MNIVKLEGTIYNQPKARVTPNGKLVANFMLKINNTTGKGFKLIPTTVWGEVEFSKEQTVKLEGSLETGSYKKGEEIIYTWNVVADSSKVEVK